MFFFDTNKKIKSDNYTIIDIETVPKDGTKVPIQIAALRIRDGIPQTPYTQDINPECPLNFWAKRNVGLDDEYLSTCPKIYEVIEEFVNYIGEDILVGCNIKGSDITPINTQYKKYFNKTIENGYVNITNLASKLIQEEKISCENPNSNELFEYFGIGDVKHTAIKDCYDEYHLFEKLKELYDDEDIAIEYQNDEKPKQKNSTSSGNWYYSKNKNNNRGYIEYLQYVDFDEKIPNIEEREICAIIQNILLENGKKTNDLYFYKHGSGLIDCRYQWSSFISFKIGAKIRYILVNKTIVPNDCITSQPSKSEDNNENVRLHFDDPSIIRKLQNFILSEYDKVIRQNELIKQPDGYNRQHSIDVCDLVNLETNAHQRYQTLLQKKEKAELDKQAQLRIKQEEKERKRYERAKRIKEIRGYQERNI